MIKQLVHDAGRQVMRAKKFDVKQWIYKAIMADSDAERDEILSRAKREYDAYYAEIVAYYIARCGTCGAKHG